MNYLFPFDYIQYVTVPNTYKLLTETDFQPVTVEAIKEYLIIPENDHSRDLMLKRMANAVVQDFDDYTRKTFRVSTFRTYRNNFPWTYFYELRRSPLISVQSIKYYDTLNVLQTVDPIWYYLTTEEYYSKIIFRSDYVFPETFVRPQAVIIEFTAGMFSTTEQVEPEIQEGILAYIAFLYENRGDLILPNNMRDRWYPMETQNVWSCHKIWEF